MASILSPSEEAQLGQTIEMFEVITQSQPHDYQVTGDSQGSLLEAEPRKGRDKHVQSASPRRTCKWASFRSAILEYETILQR